MDFTECLRCCHLSGRRWRRPHFRRWLLRQIWHRDRLMPFGLYRNCCTLKLMPAIQWNTSSCHSILDFINTKIPKEILSLPFYPLICCYFAFFALLFLFIRVEPLGLSYLLPVGFCKRTAGWWPDTGGRQVGVLRAVSGLPEVLESAVMIFFKIMRFLSLFRQKISTFVPRSYEKGLRYWKWA